MLPYCCQAQSKLWSQFLGPLYLWQCFLFQVNATKNLPTKHLPYTSYRACTTLLKHVSWSIQATLTSWRPRINLALHVAGVMSDNTKLHQYHSFKIIFTIKNGGIYNCYRTQVYLRSDLWVRVSKTQSKSFVQT